MQYAHFFCAMMLWSASLAIIKSLRPNSFHFLFAYLDFALPQTFVLLCNTFISFHRSAGERCVHNNIPFRRVQFELAVYTCGGFQHARHRCGSTLHCPYCYFCAEFVVITLTSQRCATLSPCCCLTSTTIPLKCEWSHVLLPFLMRCFECVGCASKLSKQLIRYHIVVLFTDSAKRAAVASKDCMCEVWCLRDLKRLLGYFFTVRSFRCIWRTSSLPWRSGTSPTRWRVLRVRVCAGSCPVILAFL
jgi:hypothetical protein